MSTILSDALSRAKTYDVTGQIDAGDRRMHRELTSRLGNQGYQNAALAAVAEIQTITPGDRTGGDFDLVFTLGEGVGFSVLTIAFGAAASAVQTAVDAAAVAANATYVAGDIAVTGGAFGAAGSDTLFTFSGLSVIGDATITVVATNLTGGTTDPVASETTAGVVPRFWFAALKGMGVIVGTDPAFSATPAGQYTVNLRDTLENFPSNQILRQLIKEATDQEGEDWEAELLPLLGLDRLAGGISF